MADTLLTDQIADVIVLGAGPAGLCTAIAATQMGMRVAVIEAGEVARSAHGDTLPAGIGQYFNMLGIPNERYLRDAVPFDGIRLTDVHGNSELNPVGQMVGGIHNRGLHIPRHFLDAMLYERAQELGIDVLQNCVAKKLIVQGNRVRGVGTSKGNFLCHFTVDAAGARHWLARKLGIAIDYYSPPLYGCYGWARGHCPEVYDAPHVHCSESGWVWTSRVEADLYQFTRQSPLPIEDLRHWMPEHFLAHGLKPIGPTRGADLTWQFVSRPAGRGFAMVGDSVRRSDPASNRGIERAFVDAFQLCLLLSQWKQGNLSETEVPTRYVEEVKPKYLEDLKLAYAFLRDKANAPEWARGEKFYHHRGALSKN